MNKDAFLAMSKRLQELEALNEEQARVIRDMNHELDACQEDAERYRFKQARRIAELEDENKRLRSYLEWLRVNVDSEFTEANIQAAIDAARKL